MNSNNKHKNSILTQKQFEEILNCLSDLVEKLRVTAVLLIDSAGRVIAQNKKSSWKGDPTLLSTLTAGSYSAAKEMARLLGEEDNFKMVLQEGQKYNVFISSVRDDYFLIIIFETGVALGMVRLFTKKAVAQLLPVLSKSDKEIKMEKVFDRHFQSLLGEELDRSLKEGI
jgi:predicted regulator of Ras-like GTPase activity (Roadblock/LC7/MglB family)